ncbi:MAG TPA: oligosaccharide flippase family protein [Gemmatimonadales bacterium]|nr:oligosaccharide flippase family protein [Gemmatimonadales bacterium]
MSRLRARTLAALPQGTIRRRLAGGVFWTTIGSIVGQGIIAIGSVLLARILGKEGFGQYGILQSTIGMFSVFAGLSMGYVATKHVAESIVTNKEETGRVIGLSLLVAGAAGLLVTLALAGGAQPFARRFLGSEDLAGALRIASPILLFGAVTGVQRGVLAGLEEFRAQNILVTAMAVITVGLTTVGAVLADLSGAMWGSMVGAALSLVTLSVVYHRALVRAGIPVHFRASWRERRVLWTLAFPALLNGVMVAPVVWVTNAILVNTPGGYGEMGLFNAANQWRTILMYVPSIVLTPLLPIMTQLHATREYEQLRRVLIRTLTLSVGVVGALALSFGLFARPIMQLYGRGFEAGTGVFYLIMIVSVLLSAGVVVGGLLSSTGAMWIGFLFNSVWAACMIGTALVAIPRAGALGLAFAYVLSYSIHTAIQFAYFWLYVRRNEAPKKATGYVNRPTEERLWG